MEQTAEATKTNLSQRALDLTATILASSMAFIDGSALNMALAALQAGLQASGAGLLWIINAYLLMLAALILVGGSLGDRLGRKKSSCPASACSGWPRWPAGWPRPSAG